MHVPILEFLSYHIYNKTLALKFEFVSDCLYWKEGCVITLEECYITDDSKKSRNIRTTRIKCKY